TQAAMSSRRRAISLPKAFENKWQEFLVDTDAGVSDRYLHMRFGRFYLDGNRSSAGSKFHSVVEKIPKNLLQSICISADGKCLVVSADSESNIFCFVYRPY